MIERVDFFLVLSSISNHPETFSAASGILRTSADAAQKSVGKIVGAQLASDKLTMDGLKRIRELVGTEVFNDAVDSLAATKLKGLFVKLDPHLAIPDTDRERVQHISALAQGAVEPRSAPVKKTSRRSSKSEAVAAPLEAAEDATATASAKPRPRKRMSGRSAIIVPERRD